MPGSCDIDMGLFVKVEVVIRVGRFWIKVLPASRER